MFYAKITIIFAKIDIKHLALQQMNFLSLISNAHCGVHNSSDNNCYLCALIISPSSHRQHVRASGSSATTTGCCSRTEQLDRLFRRFLFNVIYFCQGRFFAKRLQGFCYICSWVGLVRTDSMSARAGAYIPTDGSVPQGFISSHSIGNYKWIFNRQRNNPGYVSPRK